MVTALREQHSHTPSINIVLITLLMVNASRLAALTTCTLIHVHVHVRTLQHRSLRMQLERYKFGSRLSNSEHKCEFSANLVQFSIEARSLV